jgi:hypothetical protein
MLADKPAFPSSEKNGDGLHHHSHLGLTLRQYLIAHAPHKPQRWFEPAFQPKPGPFVGPEVSDQQKHEAFRLQHGYIDRASVSTESAAYSDFTTASLKEITEWTIARDKARYLQWPAAWADAILAELEKEKP